MAKRGVKRPGRGNLLKSYSPRHTSRLTRASVNAVDKAVETRERQAAQKDIDEQLGDTYMPSYPNIGKLSHLVGNYLDTEHATQDEARRVYWDDILPGLMDAKAYYAFIEGGDEAMRLTLNLWIGKCQAHCGLQGGTA